LKDKLIYVNEKDDIIGFGEKILTHKIGQLHRAFSLFIYSKDEQKFLLQKRSERKYHSGGKWSNSCCSHPYQNETWFDALQRGVSNELNLSLDISKDIDCKSKTLPKFIDKKLFFAGSFIYFSDYKELSEHEYDYVFIYILDSIISKILFNTSEISEIKWQTKDEIKEWIDKSPDDFSSWFRSAFILVEDHWEDF